MNVFSSCAALSDIGVNWLLDQTSPDALWFDFYGPPTSSKPSNPRVCVAIKRKETVQEVAGYRSSYAKA